jgi:hypothetical protein
VRRGRCDGGDHLVLVGQVGPEGLCPAAGARDLPADPLGRGLVDVDHEDRGALTGQRACRRSTDAATPAGDDGDLVHETFHAVLFSPIASTLRKLEDHALRGRQPEGVARDLDLTRAVGAEPDGAGHPVQEDLFR